MSETASKREAIVGKAVETMVVSMATRENATTNELNTNYEH